MLSSNPRRGLFVSVDGPSAAGKSTIVEHLAQLLVASGEDVHVTAEPTGGRNGTRKRSEKELERKRLRLRQLGDQRAKLLQAHYAGAIPLDLLKSEQERLTRETVEASALIDAHELSYAQIEESLDVVSTLCAQRPPDLLGSLTGHAETAQPDGLRLAGGPRPRDHGRRVGQPLRRSAD